MCKGMNRSFISVILGGFGADDSAAAGAGGKVETRPVKQGSADDAGLHHEERASKVIIVPGYGMSVSGPARPARDGRQAEGGRRRREVRHPPVAGRMPGHMNVLLAKTQRARTTRSSSWRTSTPSSRPRTSPS